MSESSRNPQDPSDMIGRLLATVRTIAVVGIKTEEQSAQPAFYVPAYLKEAGYQVLPVPVYYPEVTEILGQPVARRVQDVAPRPDLVLVFRRSSDVAGHLEDIRAAKPRAVWMQSGIRNDEVAKVLASEGIEVVQDRCMMVEHRRWSASRRAEQT